MAAEQMASRNKQEARHGPDISVLPAVNPVGEGPLLAPRTAAGGGRRTIHLAHVLAARCRDLEAWAGAGEGSRRWGESAHLSLSRLLRGLEATDGDDDSDEMIQTQ